MSLVALTMGFLGHTVPQMNVLVLGFAVRATLNLLILALSLSGAARLVVEAVPRTIEHMQRLLTM
jgi:flagellar biosynthetic protein FliR